MHRTRAERLTINYLEMKYRVCAQQQKTQTITNLFSYAAFSKIITREIDICVVLTINK